MKEISVQKKCGSRFEPRLNLNRTPPELNFRSGSLKILPNLEPNFRSGSGNLPNLELDLKFGSGGVQFRFGRGSNLEPHFFRTEIALIAISF